jgi:hypothetical protein
LETIMKNVQFDQAATLAAAHGHINISLVQRVLKLPASEAANLVDSLHEAGIVGEYDATDCRPFIAGSMNPARVQWLRARETCMQILGAENDAARGWWSALDKDRRAAVMRAAVVPFVHLSKSWDELPEGARRDLRAAHDKRRRMWVLLNGEFSGRVVS